MPTTSQYDKGQTAHSAKKRVSFDAPMEDTARSQLNKINATKHIDNSISKEVKEHLNPSKQRINMPVSKSIINLRSVTIGESVKFEPSKESGIDLFEDDLTYTQAVNVSKTHFVIKKKNFDESPKKVSPDSACNILKPGYTATPPSDALPEIGIEGMQMERPRDKITISLLPVKLFTSTSGIRKENVSKADEEQSFKLIADTDVSDIREGKHTAPDDVCVESIGKTAFSNECKNVVDCNASERNSDVKITKKTIFCGFSTGAGKEIKISDLAREKAKLIVDDSDGLDLKALKTKIDANFAKTELKESSLEKIENISETPFIQNSDNGKNMTEQIIFKGFTTGRGRNITVSISARNKAHQFMKDLYEKPTAIDPLINASHVNQPTDNASNRCEEPIKSKQLFALSEKAPLNSEMDIKQIDKCSDMGKDSESKPIINNDIKRPSINNNFLTVNKSTINGDDFLKPRKDEYSMQTNSDSDLCKNTDSSDLPINSMAEISVNPKSPVPMQSTITSESPTFPTNKRKRVSSNVIFFLYDNLNTSSLKAI